jgi:hypothetical protein
MVLKRGHDLANISPFCSRSRFLVKVVGSQTGSLAKAPGPRLFEIEPLVSQRDVVDHGARVVFASGVLRGPLF